MTQSPEDYTKGVLNKDILQQIAQSAYKDNRNAPSIITSKKNNTVAMLMESTNTVKLYRVKPTVETSGYFIIGFRGTKLNNPIDLKADASIPFNALSSSARWRGDFNTVRTWKNGKYGQWSYRDYVWIGVGHSLGGALCDEALRAGLISYAFSYNGAVQEKDKFSPKHYKVYSEKDPLYIWGKEIINQEEPEDVRPPKSNILLQTLTAMPSYVGVIAKTAEAYREHSLSRFKGGKKRQPTSNVIDKLFAKKTGEGKQAETVWKNYEEEASKELKLPEKEKIKKAEKIKDPLLHLRRELLRKD